MGRPPIGKVAMTSAERVRKHRLKQSKAHVTKPHDPVTKPAEAGQHDVTKQKPPVTKHYEARIRQLEEENAVLSRTHAMHRTQILELAGERDRWMRLANQSEESNRLLRKRKGLLTKGQFNHLKACLHAGHRNNISDEKLTQTRMAIEALEKVLVKPK